MEISLPDEAAHLIALLEQEGYQAYVVGGCVRDSLLGLIPQDFDLCTSASPEQIMAALSGYSLLTTGAKHGTITVRSAGQSYEITSFRRDGPYLDHRRPQQVEFNASLRQDLARRDFTVNALAYHPRQGLCDFHGGLADLGARRLRAVGHADSRFQEDALRIMRALRFAATLDFSIETATAAALLRNRDLLKQLPSEGIQSELQKLLLGKNAPHLLADFGEIIGVFIPEILPMLGFQQHNPYHHLDLWQHTISALGLAPPDLPLRLALLFHDIGKPSCFKLGADGIAHYLGHAEAGATLTDPILRRLRFDNATINTVCELVFYHSTTIAAQEKTVRRYLNKLGEQQLRRLWQLKQADALAHRPGSQQGKLQQLSRLAASINQVCAEGQCYSLHQLALDGHDLQELGLPPGPELGRTLDWLLTQVIEGQLPNEKQVLLSAAQTIIAPHD